MLAAVAVMQHARWHTVLQTEPQGAQQPAQAERKVHNFLADVLVPHGV